MLSAVAMTGSRVSRYIAISVPPPGAFLGGNDRGNAARLLRLVDDEALAENLLSEVFLDVWRQAASFEARSSVSTWLLEIARYKALRRRRADVELDEATV